VSGGTVVINNAADEVGKSGLQPIEWLKRMAFCNRPSVAGLATG